MSRRPVPVDDGGPMGTNGLPLPRKPNNSQHNPVMLKAQANQTPKKTKNPPVSTPGSKSSQSNSNNARVTTPTIAASDGASTGSQNKSPMRANFEQPDLAATTAKFAAAQISSISSTKAENQATVTNPGKAKPSSTGDGTANESCGVQASQDVQQSRQPREYSSAKLIQRIKPEPDVQIEHAPMKPGTNGTPKQLDTNYFKFKYPDPLFRYSVKILPTHYRDRDLVKAAKEEDANAANDPRPALWMSDQPGDIRRTVRRRILELVMVKPPLKTILSATDYSAIVITDVRLDPTTSIDILESDWTGKPTPNNGTRYIVTLELNQELRIRDYMDRVRSGSVRASFTDPDGILQALNIIAVHNIVSANLKPIPAVVCAKNFRFFPITNQPGVTATNNSWWLNAFAGFSLSSKFSDSALLLNVKKTAGIFWTSMNLAKWLIDNDRAVFSRDLLLHWCSGLRIATLHRNGVRTLSRDYCIPAEVHTWNMAGAESFHWTPPGRQASQRITVHNYFNLVYPQRQITAQDIVVNLRSSETGIDEWVPAKECMIVPGQPFPKNEVDVAQEAAFIRFAASSPGEYRGFIVNTAIGQIALGDRLDTRPLRVNCRVLGSPSLQYGKSFEQQGPKKAFWNLRGHKFRTAMTLPRWGYLKLGNSGPLRLDMISQYQAKLRAMMVEVGVNPGVEENTLVQDGSNPRLLENACKFFQDKKCRFVFVFFRDKNDKNSYSTIKRWADFNGIHTAGVAPRGGRLSVEPDYLANIILKINLKLGGINHTLQDDGKDKGYWNTHKNNTMIVGIDVTHPGLGGNGTAPSIAAVVANYDANCVQWPASIRAQDGGVEILVHLKDMIEQRLAKWKKANNSCPGRIVVYRDGVSEGQYKEVVDTELPQIRNAVHEVFPDSKPYHKITIIIVTKRHATRFFPVDDGNGRRNPEPGTVVDTGITMKGIWDFYLQSHASPLGTAKCSRYVVIKNENGNELTSDGVQSMTHHLCFMYSKAPRVPSVCPPAHFAHLACERARRYIWNRFGGQDAPQWLRSHANSWAFGTNAEPPVHPNLKETMFYV